MSLPPNFTLYQTESETKDEYTNRLCAWAHVWPFELSGVRKRIPDGTASIIWEMYQAIQEDTTRELTEETEYWYRNDDYKADTFDGLMIRTWYSMARRELAEFR